MLFFIPTSSSDTNYDITYIVNDDNFGPPPRCPLTSTVHHYTKY